MAVSGCSRCGARTFVGAHYCHECGSALGDVIDVDLFGDDPARPALMESPDPGPRRSAAVPGIVAVIAVIGAVLWAVTQGGGESTADEPADEQVAAPTSSTTTTIAAATTVEAKEDLPPDPGPPLDWQAGPDLGPAWPIAFLDDDHGIVLLAAGRSRWVGAGGALAWRSVDGEIWEALGEVIPDSSAVTAAHSIGDEMVAIGLNGDDLPTVWHSDDGKIWVPQVLPTAGVENASYLQPVVVGGTADLRVVVAYASNNIFRTLSRAFEEQYGIDISDVTLRTSGPPLQTELVGPLGLGTLTLSADELGLSDVDLYLPAGEVNSPKTMWISVAGGAWQLSPFEPEFINGLYVTANSDVVLARANGKAWTSGDGIDWVESRAQYVRSVVDWGGGYLAIGRSGGIVRSIDGVDWMPVDLRTALDSDGWEASSLAAGTAGVAITMTRYGAPGPSEDEPVASVTLLKDGYALTLTDRTQVTLTRAGTEVLQFFLGGAAPDIYDADLLGGTVTFIDPDTGDPLVTFTTAELSSFERSVWSNRSANPESVVVFSEDLVSWQSGHIDSTAGQEVFVTSLHVADGVVVAAGGTSGGPFGNETGRIYFAELADESG